MIKVLRIFSAANRAPWASNKNSTIAPSLVCAEVVGKKNMAGCESLIPHVRELASKTQMTSGEAAYLISRLQFACDENRKAENNPDNTFLREPGSLSPLVMDYLRALFINYFEGLLRESNLDENMQFEELGDWMGRERSMRIVRERLKMLRP